MIRDAANAVVDAFNAFVAWAIELITSTVHAILGPVLGPLADMQSSHSIGVCSALLMMAGDRDDSSEVSGQSLGPVLSGTMPLFTPPREGCH